MDTAELYLSLIRPNKVPIVGECLADPPFTGQIQVEKWNWTLQNDQEIKAAEEDGKDYDRHKELLGKQPALDLRKKLQALNEENAVRKRQEARTSANDTYDSAVQGLSNSADDNAKRAKATKARKDALEKIDADEKKETEKAKYARENLTRDLSRREIEALADLDKEVAEYATDVERQIADTTKAIQKRDEDYAKANRSWDFSFSKRVDFATTQMLNSMKAGDVFPIAILTIYQRSSNAGMGLVITVTNLRLTDYSVRADVSETMTDMKEQWKAEFSTLAYVYKNRKIIDGLGTAGEAAAKLATQNTVRTFVMKKDLGI